MVLAHHLMWSAYGCWLPNDPRGISSIELREEKLAPLGEIHPGRKPVQPASSTIRSFYREADPLLDHDRWVLNDEDILFVAASIGHTVRERGYTCHGCVIMPDHIHLVIRRHRDWAEHMLAGFQENSRAALITAGCRPADHPVWGGPGWKVFLSSPEQIRTCVRYVRENPIKARRPVQNWDFVKDTMVGSHDRRRSEQFGVYRFAIFVFIV
jgi:REP element-mobilizing transposase RayT